MSATQERSGIDSPEPIAIIGMACRYPGEIASPEDLWEFISAGRHSAAEMPTDRGWDLKRLLHSDQTMSGRSSSRYGGGFLSDGAMFDPEFFGISPRDAVAMSPVQRLMLMTAWETFEHAGIIPETVRGQDIGTFVGIFSPEYGPLWHEAAVDVEGKLITGSQHSATSGRVSHFFGLSGPCITADTGCSASLVGVHLAIRSLRSGECSMAFAGGASFNATPGQFTEFTRQGALAPDGKCKAFAESADGTSWSEGVGLLLLARLSDALRDGHRVLGVIRGSAVNHDGDGDRFTVPNGRAHERLINQALADAGLAAHEVDAVDAHGTGTRVGDPIEAGAILATYGQRSVADKPLLLGSLKSNLGHATAAAGVGSIIKMVQAMRHDMLPPTLHVDKPSSRIDWSSGSVRLVTEATPWRRGDRPRRAAISSFGIGGTNAHVIVEDPPPAADPGAERDDHVPTGLLPWILSGRTEQALRDQASALRQHVAAHPELSVVDVGETLATSRTRFEHRAAVVASRAEDFLAGLDAIDAVEFADSVVTGVAMPSNGVAFVFPGQGAQWQGMATELAAASPVFSDYLGECADALAPYCDWSLFDVLHGVPGAPSLDRVDVVQPALFAVMVALARMWTYHGVQPRCVIGHSQGEIAAACIAGALSLADAAKVVALRSRALRTLPGDYGMVSVALSAEQVRPLLTGDLSVAVDNGPRATVVAGPRTALDELVADLIARGERTRVLAVDYASHSAQVESVRAEMLSALADIAPRASDIPFYSTVTGGPLDTTAVTAEYWYTNLRQTVRFDEAVRAVLGDGVRHFVEVSPRPLLLNTIEEIADNAGAGEVAVLGSLRPDDRGMDGFTRYLGQAFAHGLPVDGAALFAGLDGRLVDLPAYRFQKRKFWLGNGSATADLATHGLGATGHPLVGAAINLADGSVVLSGTLSTNSHPWLADHGVYGVVVVPGAAFVEMVMRAADEVGCDFVEELVLAAPLVLPDDQVVAIQVVVGDRDDAERRTVNVYSRPTAGEDSGWTCHANGVVTAVENSEQARVDAWPPTGADSLDVGGFYDQLVPAGYSYGDAFTGVRALWRRDAELFAEVALPDHIRNEAGLFAIHPALLDAALQPLLVDILSDGQTRLPFSIDRVRVHASGASALRVRLTVRGEEVSVSATDSTGLPVLSIGTVATRPVTSGQLAVARRSTTDSLLRIRWSPIPAPDLADGVAADASVLWCAETEPRQAAAWALASVQSFLREEIAGSARLVLVTRGAVACSPGDDVNAAQAAVWGLVRSARSEHPDRFVLVDVDGQGSSAALPPAVLALGEPELAIRGDVVSVPRLARVADENRMTVPDAPSWHLEIIERGTLESLALIPDESASAPLAPGQVRIAVRAVGLNFRDVLVSLGLVPGDEHVGVEGAGVVVETGPGEAGLAVGDRVLGIWRQGFSSIVTVDRRLVARFPPEWTFAQAASVPIAYATALYGLRDLGRLRPGERVLVHAAAGGVGVAAVHVANWLGAEVFGTASPAKWPVLRDLGLTDDHIASSRTTEFADRFPAVDVVLNSLTGEMLDASLGKLAPGGRFVEMGKTDLRDPADLDVNYQAFDLMGADAGLLGGLLAEAVHLLEQGEFAGLPPVRAWDVRQATEALSFMRQGKHVGKNVLTLPPALDPGGTVLLTGGTGVLGGLLARHLVTEYSVRNLVLTSRSGPDAPGSTELVAELAELGAHARIAACDVADRAQVEALVAEMGSGLTGVVHLAGALDDGAVESLTAQRLDVVFRPKVDGARHLDELTRHLDLGLFVLFSSVAGTLGTPGQAGYAAANTAMDALALRRRAAGLPAQSLAWGFWQSASGLTGHLDDADRDRLARNGVLPMPTQQALALFDAAGADGGAALVTAMLNPNSHGAGLSPLLRDLAVPTRRAAGANGPARDRGSQADKLAKMPAPHRADTLVRLVRSHAATVLGYPGPDAIGRDRPFRELGIDSLTAVELRNRIGAETGVRLSPTVVFDHPSPLRLAEYITARLEPAPDDETPQVPVQQVAAASGERIDEMDIEALVAMVNNDFAEPDGELR